MTDNIKMIHTWCGTPVAELTREQLEGAFSQLAMMYESAILDRANMWYLRRRIKGEK